MCPPCWAPFPPPFPSHPSGSSQCTSPECPVSCIKLGLAIYFTYEIYMIQCYSLKSSHPHLLPQNPKVCSLSLCLFYCFTYRVIVIIFLEAYICISMLYWCFSFWLTSLCIRGSSLIHRLRTDSNAFFFNSWVIFHCVYVPQLSYPFVCWWMSRLFPCPGYCKQCCNEHWGTRVSFNSGFLSVYAQQWDCWVIWQFYFHFFKESPHSSP